MVVWFAPCLCSRGSVSWWLAFTPCLLQMGGSYMRNARPHILVYVCDVCVVLVTGERRVDGGWRSRLVCCRWAVAICGTQVPCTLVYVCDVWTDLCDNGSEVHTYITVL